MSNARKRRRMQPKHTLDVTVSIVIPVHRRVDLLKLCLDAIPEAVGEYSYKIILVNNGTPTEEQIWNEPDFNCPNLEVIDLKGNYGYPRACNIGAKGVTSPYLFMLNSDVVLDPGSIAKIIESMDIDPTVGIAGMKLVFPMDVGEKLNPSIRPAGKLQHIGLATNVRGEIFHAYLGWSEDHPKVNAVHDMYGVTGAGMMLRTKIWKKAGGFREEYGLGTYEDIDLCLTVREMGYNIIVVPEARGIHYTGATAEYYGYSYPMGRNRMIFLGRWKDKLQYTELWSW